MFQFADILGQEDTKASLIAQANSGKLHHAHLFLGKMGYGTFQLAMAFLKYIYCSDKAEVDSCGNCSNCQKIEKLAHIDIHFTLPTFKREALSEQIFPEFKKMIEEHNALFDLKDWIDYNKEKNVKIRSAECEVILHNMGLSSFEDNYKTQVIWMAETMEKESNKILKILEEPSPNTLFILIAESSETILPTILSRCNIHKVFPLKNEDVRRYIEAEDIPQHKEAIDRAVHFAEGDTIEAKRYLEDEESEFPLEANLLTFLRGLIHFHERKFSNINTSIMQAEVLASQSKPNQKKFLDYFQYFIRQIILLKYTDQCQLNPQLLKAAQYFAQHLDIDQIEAWTGLIDKYHRAIDGNANVKISFVSLAVESGKIQHRDEFEPIAYK